jgi:hypothetical protein
MPSEALMNCGLSSTTFCFVWIALKDIGVAGSFDLQLTREVTMSGIKINIKANFFIKSLLLLFS